MTEPRASGRSLVTRRAILDIVRPAVSGSYGVIGFADAGLRRRVLRRLGLGEPGIRLSLKDGLAIDLYLTVAYGLPVAEVARQADSAVRYALRRGLGHEVSRLTVHVGGLRFQPVPPRAEVAVAAAPPSAAAVSPAGASPAATQGAAAESSIRSVPAGVGPVAPAAPESGHGPAPAGSPADAPS